MAKYNSTTFGKISGRHGTAVSAIVNGQPILKVFSPAGNPNTPAQQEQRLKFALITKALQPLRNVIAVGFGNRRGFYQAVSLGLRNAFTGTFPNLSVDYAKVVLSSGSLPQSSSVSVTKGNGTQVTATWDTAVWNNGTPLDVVHIVFFNEANKMSYSVPTQLLRSAGTYTSELPALFTGATVHAWIFFVSPGGDQRSESQYLGSLTF